MTEDEIRKVVSITNTADNGCSTCATALALQLAITFPSFLKEISEIFGKEYGYSLEEFTDMVAEEKANG